MDHIVGKFIKLVMIKIFETYDDIDLEIFELTGVSNLDEMSQRIASKVCEVVTESQYCELQEMARTLMGLCIELKLSSGCEEVKNKVYEHIISSFSKISKIIIEHKNNN